MVWYTGTFQGGLYFTTVEKTKQLFRTPVTQFTTNNIWHPKVSLKLFVGSFIKETQSSN